MQIGVCTTDFAAQPVEQLFSRIAAYGFTQVQFSFSSIGEDEMPESVSKSLLSRIRRSLKVNQLELVAINATFNMIHPDLAERSKGIARFPLLAYVAQLLDCPVLTLCSGTNDTEDMWRWHPDNETELSWRNMIAVMEDLLLCADKNDLYLGVETEASNVVSSTERARRLLDEVSSPRLKIVMDCANLFQKGSARPELVRSVIGKAFDLLGSAVILAHGKDLTEGESLRFTTPGKGIIDYNYFLEQLRLSGYSGGMLLHGIQNESEIPECLAFMRKEIAQVFF